MNLQDLLELFGMVIGGLGLFLYGMSTLSQSLQTLGSSVIKQAINYITANRIFACIVGIVVTFLVQSSSVSTVMMSSFVNSGLMTLTQGVGFIFGANKTGRGFFIRSQSAYGGRPDAESPLAPG